MKQKDSRYYWWLVQEYIRKHIKIILLSFFFSVLVVFVLVSFSSSLDTFLFPRRNIIGVVATSSTVDRLPSEITEKISSGLVYIDEKGQIRPAVAAWWELKNEGREFNFKLKKGVYWSDGKELVAQDIQYRFPDVKTQVIDDATVRFILKAPLPIFPTLLTRPMIRQNSHGILGRYKISKIQYDEGKIKKITLIPHNIQDDTLIYKIYATEEELIRAYKLGQIREMKLHSAQAKEFENDWKNTHVTIEDDYSLMLTLFFNTSKGILSEKDARQAIAYAIDRNKLMSFGELANGPIQQTSWAFNTESKHIQYDPEFAKKKMQKLLSATESATLKLATYYEFDDVATYIKNDLKALSIDADVRFNDYEGLQNFDMILSYWKVPEDPDQYHFWHSTQPESSNVSRLKSVKIDKLLEDGRNIANTKERQEIYYDFQKVMLDELPAVFLYYPKAYVVRRREASLFKLIPSLR